MPDEAPFDLSLTAAEMAVAKRIAKREGISEDEAATILIKQALERRVKKKSGHGLAHIYTMKRGNT